MYSKTVIQYKNEFFEQKDKMSKEDFLLDWFQKDHTVSNVQGSEIVEFLKNKNIFITGGTGFLGKLLLEKLLRSCNEIGNVYLLIRPKKGKHIQTRVDDLCEDIIFSKLEQINPKFAHKIVAIKGDISLPNLGIDPEERIVLTERIDVIFHVAATVKFNEKIQIATQINVKGTLEIVNLAKSCKHLKSLVHVSTAYSNCIQTECDEKFYHLGMGYKELIDLTENSSEEDLEKLTKKIMKVWPNTYTFTKHTAENVIQQNCQNLPVCVFRPSIVISTYKEPLKSWHETLFGPQGMNIGVGLGVLHSALGDPNIKPDLVPGDYVVNAMIAASYQTAIKTRHDDSDPIVFNYTIPRENSVDGKKYINSLLKDAHLVPSIRNVWCISVFVTKHKWIHFILTLFLHYLPALLIDFVFLVTFRKPRVFKLYRKIERNANAVSYFCLREWQFKHENVKQLWKNLSDSDRTVFPFDMNDIDWDIYFFTVGIGCRYYIIKEDHSTLPAARKRHEKYN